MKTDDDDNDKPISPQRHRNMAAIHSTGTKPEMIVRKYLFARGYRYRLNHPRLPGHPDIVLRRYRAVIFVNGCFWHGHEGCRYFRMPTTRRDFWERKITRNRERDAAEQRRLAAMGWHCITVWECQLRPTLRQFTLAALDYTLSSLYLSQHSPALPPTAIAAEPATPYTPEE